MKFKCVDEIIDNQIIDDQHLDSFWYDGVVLRFKHRNKEYVVCAEGDIRIHDKKGELVWDSKPRNSGIDLKQDKDLKKIDDVNYFWENNNWFEVSRKGDVCEPDIIMSLKELDGLMKLIDDKSKE